MIDTTITDGHVIYVIPATELRKVAMAMTYSCNKILHVSDSGKIKRIKDRWGGIPNPNDPIELLINDEVERRLKLLLLQQALDC